MLKKVIDTIKANKTVYDAALSVISSKYNEEFAYFGPWGTSISDTREFLAVNDRYPGKTILINVVNYKTDAPVYLDNYQAILQEENVTGYLLGKFEEHFERCKVFHAASKNCLSAALGADTSFEEFLGDPSTFISAIICLKASAFTSAEHLESILGNILPTSCSMQLDILFIEDDDFENCDTRSLRDIHRKNDEMAFLKAKSVNGSVTFSWRKGA